MTKNESEARCLVPVVGLPGSGKSFFASRFAEALGAVYLSSDVMRMKCW
ncbi:AAA family ATPase [Chryseolinea lacunae]|uniref:AAA family ATPase n=1 Tax=Chryseolinea lacunae TaxID=2801331 RepID=A0ABS1KNP5_9BACT|nr:AAA family ATPase [Chryseolinea lacunae]